jgi:hypothetical protein
VVGLLRRSALGVDRRSTAGPVVALGEPGLARDVVRLLARLGHAAADHLLDVRALDPVALQERRLDAAQQMGGVHPGEISLDHLAPADRGSDRVDDDGFSHDSLTFYLSGC